MSLFKLDDVSASESENAINGANNSAKTAPPTERHNTANAPLQDIGERKRYDHVHGNGSVV
jgi:hypothetical protein